MALSKKYVKKTRKRKKKLAKYQNANQSDWMKYATSEEDYNKYQDTLFARNIYDKLTSDKTNYGNGMYGTSILPEDLFQYINPEKAKTWRSSVDTYYSDLKAEQDQYPSKEGLLSEAESEKHKKIYRDIDNEMENYMYDWGDTGYYEDSKPLLWSEPSMFLQRRPESEVRPVPLAPNPSVQDIENLVQTHPYTQYENQTKILPEYPKPVRQLAPKQEQPFYNENLETQKILNKLGYGLEEDGIVGEKTRAAMKDAVSKGLIPQAQQGGIVSLHSAGLPLFNRSGGLVRYQKGPNPREQYLIDFSERSHTDTLLTNIAAGYKDIQDCPDCYPDIQGFHYSGTEPELSGRELERFNALTQAIKDKWKQSGVSSIPAQTKLKAQEKIQYPEAPVTYDKNQNPWYPMPKGRSGGHVYQEGNAPLTTGEYIQWSRPAKEVEQNSRFKKFQEVIPPTGKPVSSYTSIEMPTETITRGMYPPAAYNVPVLQGRQSGGLVKYQSGPSWPQPTRQDSIDLLRNTEELQKFYKDYDRKKAYTQDEARDYTGLNYIEALANAADQQHQKSERNLYTTVPEEFKDKLTYIAPSKPNAPFRTGTLQGVVPPELYREEINPYQFKQREADHGVLNLNAPMSLIDRRIEPSYNYRLYNNDSKAPLYGDLVGIQGYDPLQITPRDLLNPEQQKQRDAGTLKSGPSFGTDPNPVATVTAKPYKPNLDTDLSAYLMKAGKPFSFKDRKALAKKHGITGYKGTADQNLELLELVKTGKIPSAKQPSEEKPAEAKLIKAKPGKVYQFARSGDKKRKALKGEQAASDKAAEYNRVLSDKTTTLTREQAKKNYPELFKKAGGYVRKTRR